MPSPAQDWCTVTDITNRMTAAGMPAPTTERATRARARAIRDFENAVQWFPFLNRDTSNDDPPGTGPVVQSRVFMAPGPDQPPGLMFTAGGGYQLSLDCGLISLTSLTINGVAYVQNIQYWLEPINAPFMLPQPYPYTRVKFLISPWSTPYGVVITGVWGFCTTLPDDAYDASLARACLLCAPEASGTRSGGMASFREGPLEERYAVARDTGPWADVKTDWAAQYRDGVNAYARLFG